jgi:hypothetical protein
VNLGKPGKSGLRCGCAITIFLGKSHGPAGRDLVHERASIPLARGSALTDGLRMTGCRATRISLACFVGSMLGCIPVFRGHLAPPGEFLVTRDQLVIHSDFPLPSHHRLIEELIARRNDLAQHLNLPVSDETIQIYLFEHADNYQAFMQRYYPQFPARRAFFVETDTHLTIYAYWGDRVAEDLRHEVTHGYLHAAIPHVPLWLDEGLAEYYETPRGRQGWNTEHAAWLAEQLREGRWRPDLWRLEQLPSTAALTSADYAEAWGWVHYLLQSAPEQREVLRRYLADLRRDGQAETVSARLRAMLGDPGPVLMEYLRAQLAARSGETGS